MSARLKNALKAGLGLLLLAALVWMVDWRNLLPVLKNLTAPGIAALLLLAYALVLVSCVKWRLFLVARGAPVALGKLVDLYVVGYFFNNFAPSNVGGDVARSYILGAHIGSQSNSFGTVFLERFTGLVALSGLAVAAACLRPELLANRLLLALLAGLAAGFVAILLLTASQPAQQWARRALGRLPARLPAAKLGKFLDVVFYFRDHRGIMVQALGLSVLYHVLTILNTYAAVWALGLRVDFLDLAVVVPVVLMVSAVPVSLNALGIMEGAFVYFLGLAGLNSAEALSIALVLRAKNVLLALLGGLLFLRWNHRARAPQPQGRP